MMYGSIIDAFTQAFAYHFNILQTLSTINVGSFNRFTSFNLLYVIIIPVLLAYVYAVKFNIVSLGEDFSKSLGISYNQTVILEIILIATISASTFVTVGPIPFVGLIIPNIINTLIGDNFKRNIIDVALVGSCFVLASDIFSRLMVYPYEVAISFTIGIFGGVILIGLIFRRRSHEA